MKLKLVEAGDQGFNEAGEEYKKMLLGLIAKAHQEGEVKGVKETHSRSFLTGYQVGLDYARIATVSHLREPPPFQEIKLPSHPVPQEQPNPDATNADATA